MKTMAVICLVMLAAVINAETPRPSTIPASQPALVPLKFKLPPPLFEVKRYEANQNRGRPDAERPPDPNIKPLMVPAGTANLARGKPVTLSCEPAIGDAKALTDGSRFTAEGEWVEVGEGAQWVQVDLGQQAAIHAIALWRSYWFECVYFDTVIQICDSPAFDKEVRTVFNNSLKGLDGVVPKGHDQPYVETHKGKLIAVAGVEGRYVRVWSNGSTSDKFNNFVELEVYGMPSAEVETNKGK